MFKEYLSFVREYVFSLRKFALASFLVLVFAASAGFFYAQGAPSEVEEVLKELQATLEPVMEMTPLGQFLVIFLNNSIAALLAVVLGLIFGVFPALVLLSNGMLLGIVVYFAQNAADWPTVLALTLPHGIIEIPVIILACAAGLKLGKVFFDKIFKKQNGTKAELRVALSFFLKFLLPLLALAAAIEALVIGRFL